MNIRHDDKGEVKFPLFVIPLSNNKSQTKTNYVPRLPDGTRDIDRDSDFVNAYLVRQHSK